VDSSETSGHRSPSNIAEYFGRLAATYGDGEYYGKRRRAVLKAIAGELAEARDVLDVGCGNGAYLAKFAAAPGNRVRGVTGADLSIEMLLAARRRVGLKCRLLCADVSRLPFKPESFDFIFASHVLQFVADVDLDNVVSGFARCLPPGGLLVATGRRDEGFRQLLRTIVGADRWPEYREVIFQHVPRRDADAGPDNRYQQAFARSGLRVEERAAPFTVGWADIEELINVRWMPLIPEGEREQARAMLAEIAELAKAGPSASLTLREPLILGRRDR
jgi:ubiquinone/menaquinone biosynthesis C-methylase UbiE